MWTRASLSADALLSLVTEQPPSPSPSPSSLPLHSNPTKQPPQGHCAVPASVLPEHLPPDCSKIPLLAHRDALFVVERLCCCRLAGANTGNGTHNNVSNNESPAIFPPTRLSWRPCRPTPITVNHRPVLRLPASSVKPGRSVTRKHERRIRGPRAVGGLCDSFLREGRKEGVNWFE